MIGRVANRGSGAWNGFTPGAALRLSLSRRTRVITQVACATLLTVGIARAQAVGDTVTVDQRVLLTPDLTQLDVKRRALEGALAEAVRRVAGVRVQSGELSIREERSEGVRDGFVSVVQLDAAGRATSYRLVDDAWISSHHPELGAQLYYRLRVSVTVQRELGTPDAGFQVAASLNAELFTVGDGPVAANGEVIVTVTSTRPAYITVLAIADDSVTRLMPNAYMTPHRITAGTSYEFPDRSWRETGIHLRVTLPAGRESRRELIAVVATRHPLDFPPSATILALQQWLVGIPLDQRAISFAPYEIRRR